MSPLQSECPWLSYLKYLFLNPFPSIYLFFFLLFVIFHFCLFIYGLSLWGWPLLKWLMISAFCCLFVPLWKFPPSWVSVGPCNSFLMNRISKSNGIQLHKRLWQPFCLLLHSLLLWRQQTTMLWVAYGEVHVVRNWCLWPTVSKGLRPINSHLSELEADSLPVGPEMNAALADILCLVTLSWRPPANSQKLR